MHAPKSNRRKAIDCKLIEESASNPGYFKYMVTIQEIDGTINQQPAYGVDMQDAIKRLVRSENADMVVKIVERKQQFFLMALFAFCIIIPLVGGYNSIENKNWWMILPLITIIVLFLSFGILDSYRSQNK
tara:strand:+ start:3810 stop:4199 length:390 start_codon:yes stop_codon:yes gene_type:complete